MEGIITDVRREYRHIEVEAVNDGIKETFQIDLNSIECGWHNLHVGDRLRFDPVRLALHAKRV